MRTDLHGRAAGCAAAECSRNGVLRHGGIDNNPSTRGAPDAGSARFHVVIDGQRVFSTPVLTLGGGPLFIRVPLHGARQFAIEVDDGATVAAGTSAPGRCHCAVPGPFHRAAGLRDVAGHPPQSLQRAVLIQLRRSTFRGPAANLGLHRVQADGGTDGHRAFVQGSVTGLLVECEITSYTAHAASIGSAGCTTRATATHRSSTILASECAEVAGECT